LKNAAPLGHHFWFPRPKTYREPRDLLVALSRLFQTPFHRPEGPSDARNFNPDFPKHFSFSEAAPTAGATILEHRNFGFAKAFASVKEVS
jgi:hypothetical protein